MHVTLQHGQQGVRAHTPDASRPPRTSNHPPTSRNERQPRLQTASNADQLAPVAVTRSAFSSVLCAPAPAPAPARSPSGRSSICSLAARARPAAAQSRGRVRGATRSYLMRGWGPMRAGPAGGGETGQRRSRGGVWRSSEQVPMRLGVQAAGSKREGDEHTTHAPACAMRGTGPAHWQPQHLQPLPALLPTTMGPMPSATQFGGLPVAWAGGGAPHSRTPPPLTHTPMHPCTKPSLPCLCLCLPTLPLPALPLLGPPCLPVFCVLLALHRQHHSRQPFVALR